MPPLSSFVSFSGGFLFVIDFLLLSGEVRSSSMDAASSSSTSGFLVGVGFSFFGFFTEGFLSSSPLSSFGGLGCNKDESVK